MYRWTYLKTTAAKHQRKCTELTLSYCREGNWPIFHKRAAIWGLFSKLYADLIYILFSNSRTCQAPL